MAKNTVYQFKITLEGISPPIWRRIQVLDRYSFWDLHVAIQDAMGWEDYHLHQFNAVNPKTGNKERIGIPEHGYEESTFGDEKTLAGWKLKIKDYFSETHPSMEYEYDFGDDWVHIIKFEGEVEKEEKVQYPRCIEGKRACPPEDVGGAWGYAEYLKILSNPNHEEYKNTLEWRGPFDPEAFDKDTHFDNPKERFKIAFEDRF